MEASFKIVLFQALSHYSRHKGELEISEDSGSQARLSLGGPGHVLRR